MILTDSHTLLINWDRTTALSLLFIPILFTLLSIMLSCFYIFWRLRSKQFQVNLWEIYTLTSSLSEWKLSMENIDINYWLWLSLNHNLWLDIYSVIRIKCIVTFRLLRICIVKWHIALYSANVSPIRLCNTQHNWWVLQFWINWQACLIANIVFILSLVRSLIFKYFTV